MTAEQPPSKELIRHASAVDDRQLNLCSAAGGHRTKPKESVNCPACRVIMNHVRDRYPEHASYTDWRLTRDQVRQAARDMRADLVGGEIEG